MGATVGCIAEPENLAAAAANRSLWIAWVDAVAIGVPNAKPEAAPPMHSQPCHSLLEAPSALGMSQGLTS
jgi:hypothetical protein